MLADSKGQWADNIWKLKVCTFRSKMVQRIMLYIVHPRSIELYVETGQYVSLEEEN